VYQKALAAKGLGAITTEIAPSAEFYFAEDYHQQYLAKNPAGYCGLGGTGVSCPIGVGVTARSFNPLAVKNGERGFQIPRQTLY
jgi:peptide-methionine (S)-S-oxide reductase